MGVCRLDKAIVPAQTRGELSQPGSLNHRCATDLPLGGDQMDDLFQDPVPAGECKNKGKKQLRLGQVTVPAGIYMG